MSRILGLDLGSKTLGIAISDNLEMIASALETFTFKENDFSFPLRRVLEIIDEKKITKIVLGYPKHMNGDIGDKALLCEEFKKSITEKINIQVILMDERWTTKLAQNRLLEFDLSRSKRKKIIDKMAAVIILQNYLDSKRGER